MAWVLVNGRLGVPNPGSVDTEAKVPVGTIAVAEDPTYGSAEFIYLAGVASTAQYDWVTYNMDDGGTTRLAANAIGPVAIASAAIVASRWGWYCISGKHQGNAASNFADNGNVYATATAGRIDDAIVAGDRVKNAKGASAESSNLADFEIARPFMDDALAA